MSCYNEFEGLLPQRNEPWGPRLSPGRTLRFLIIGDKRRHSLLRISGWNEHFETHKTRILKRMDWVPFPNKFDGDGYTELVDHQDGASHFGVWCALLLLASKCDPRGHLVRSGGVAHDSASLARVTRLQSAVIAPAIARLLKIGWLELSGDDTALSGANPAQTGRYIEGNGTEGKGREGNALSRDFPLTAEEMESAWDRHRSFKGNEPKDLAFRRIFGMNGQFNADRFRSNHPKWCVHWARIGWNSYGSLTFLGWIEAGMPEPPDPPKGKESLNDMLDRLGEND
jgi:hypothetical protein